MYWYDLGHPCNFLCRCQNVQQELGDYDDDSEEFELNRKTPDWMQTVRMDRITTTITDFTMVTITTIEYMMITMTMQ